MSKTQYSNLGYSWMNGIFIFCSGKVPPLIQRHSVQFAGASPPQFHDDISSLHWNLLMSESCPDKQHAISWSLGHRGYTLVMSCVTWRRDSSFCRSTGWLINIWLIFGNQSWVLHSGAITKALVWSFYNLSTTVDSILNTFPGFSLGLSLTLTLVRRLFSLWWLLISNSLLEWR